MRTPVLRGKGVFLSIWWTNETYEFKRGYTPRNSEDMATFRIGPLCIAWEGIQEH